MLDRRFIRDNPEAVKAAVRVKGIDLDVDELLRLDQSSRELQRELDEAQTQRILCPCHQSQFLATEYARPVFGPATRSLPQLPITVDERGYLVAAGDFREPVGPAFWERRNV